MSSRPKSEHLFITCSDTRDLREKKDMDSVVNKLFSNGKYKQVINTSLIQPKLLPVLRSDMEIKKTYSGMA